MLEIKKTLAAPLDSTALSSLAAGDVVELSGVIYTARDAAHARFARAAAENKPLPFSLAGELLFYAGPCPARPPAVIGSIAPTTSLRMDDYLELTYLLGSAGSIGKGPRSALAAEMCKKYRRVYFLSFGGIAALISKCVKKCAVIAYEDLGTESVKALSVEKLRLIVGIDCNGNVFDEAQREKYRKKPV